MKKFFLFLSLVTLFFSYALAKVSFTSKSSRILERGAVTELKGDVRIIMPNLLVTAQEAAYREKEGIIKAREEVYVKYSSTTWDVEGWCRELVITSEAESLVMSGDVKTIYRIDASSNKVIEMYANRIKFDYSDRQEAFFKGNVRAKGDTITVSSNDAFYSRKSEKIEFTGLPKAVSTAGGIKSEYSGDLINMHTNSKKIRISGSAHAVIYLKEEEFSELK